MRKERMVSAALAGIMLVQTALMGGCGAGKGAETGVEETTEQQTESLQALAEEQADAAESAETTAMADAADTAETAAMADAAETVCAYPTVDVVTQHTDGANGFAFRLTNQMLKEAKEGENFILSPYSVYLPLAALYNATDDTGRDALAAALGQSGMDADTWNELTSRVNAALLQEEQAAWMEENGQEFESPLKIANAVFVDDDEQVKQEFASVFEEVYQGKLFTVDFADDASAKEVNDWAAEQTDGKITEVIEKFDPDTVAAIANSIYFSDTWADAFDEEQTQPDVFHGQKQDEKVPFMNQRFMEMQYYEDEAMQAVVFPTTYNGQLLLLLPGEGIPAEKLLERMDAGILETIQEAESRTVQLSLPKFKLESGPFSVKEALEAMGVPLTEAKKPCLSGLVEGEPLYISEAVQKAMLEVDERGMTAAAVTVMGLTRMSMPVEINPVDVKFDRPFALILTADGGGDGQQVLFTGVVNHAA